MAPLNVCKVLFVYFRERESTCISLGQAVGEGERISSKLCAELRARCGAQSDDPEIMTWAQRVKPSTNCTTQVPLNNFPKWIHLYHDGKYWVLNAKKKKKNSSLFTWSYLLIYSSEIEIYWQILLRTSLGIDFRNVNYCNQCSQVSNPSWPAFL